MFAIASKFPDQKRFATMDIKTGVQVNNWVYCTLFKTKQRAEEVLQQIKPLMLPDVELKVLKYQNS
jgi:hypothetical protein